MKQVTLTRQSASESVGIREVAKEAGVSLATVSRVLNTPEKVKASTMQRVQAAIDELNYVPNAAGRALKTQRTRIVGAVVPHIAYSAYSDFIMGVQQRLKRAGYNLVLAISGYYREEEYEEVKQLIMAGAEAIILAGEGRDPEVYRLLSKNKIPYVLNSVYHPDSDHPCVGLDNYDAAERVTSYLLDLGHKHIGVLTGSRSKIDRFGERVLGVSDCLKRAGLTLPDEWVTECRVESIVDARSGFRQLISGASRPSAVVCCNDVLALGALLEAQAMGIRVPEDISVTGFGNAEWTSQMSPSLTVVAIPLMEIGTRAGDFLIGKLRGEAVAHTTKVEVSLIVRQSTGPYRK